MHAEETHTRRRRASGMKLSAFFSAFSLPNQSRSDRGVPNQSGGSRFLASCLLACVFLGATSAAADDGVTQNVAPPIGESWTAPTVTPAEGDAVNNPNDVSVGVDANRYED